MGCQLNEPVVGVVVVITVLRVLIYFTYKQADEEIEKREEYNSFAAGESREGRRSCAGWSEGAETGHD